MGDFQFKKMKSYLLTGISYMIPICIIGGMFFALSIGFGANITADNGVVMKSQFWINLQSIGSAGLFMMVPVVGAYIAYAIAGKPALGPAFVLCYIANTEVGASSVKTGFLGAMLLGMGTGIMISYLKKVKWPNVIKPIVPIIIIPLVTTLVLGVLYIEVLVAPIGALVSGMTDFLMSMSSSSMILVAILIGVFLAFDMGGPINKTCTLFVLVMVESGRYEFLAMLGVGACVPAIGMGLATLLSKKRYTNDEQLAGKTSLIMGIMGLTEGAIPLAAADALRVIPSICTGAAVGSVIAYLTGATNYAPHGGLIVLPAVMGKMGYVLAILGGSVTVAFMVNLLKKPIGAKDEEVIGKEVVENSK